MNAVCSFLVSARKERKEADLRGARAALPRVTQRLSYADFFGYFLVRRQESNIPVLGETRKEYRIT